MHLPLVGSYRLNWLIFKALWALIFITLKLLMIYAQLVLSMG